MKNQRISKLDGLRGVAILMVVLNHSLYLFSVNGIRNIWQYTYRDPLSYIGRFTQLLITVFNGSMAVAIFFVLSAYLMARSLDKRSYTIRSVVAFWVQRLFRLYPLYFVVLCLISAYLIFTPVPPVIANISSWLEWRLYFRFSVREFLYNAMLLSSSFTGVTWFLQVLLTGSFFLPLFYGIYKYFPNIVYVVLLVLIIYLGTASGSGRLLHNLFMFPLGVLIVGAGDLFKKAAAHPLIRSGVLFSVLIASLMSRFVFTTFYSNIFESLGAYFVIGSVVYTDISGFDLLEHPNIVWVGQRSYGIFLVHIPILMIFASYMLPQIPFTAAQTYGLVINVLHGVAVFIVSAIVSHILYITIEKPCIRISKYCTHKI